MPRGPQTYKGYSTPAPQPPPGGLIARGEVANVAADGSAGTVVALPFSTAIVSLKVGVSNNYASNNWELTVQTTSEGPGAFTVFVSGGPVNSTVSVWYEATGT